MASKSKVGIIVGVSVVLLGVTAYLIYRGMKSSKDAMNKLNAQGGGNVSTPTSSDASSTTTPSTTTTTTTTPTTTTSETTPTSTQLAPSKLIIQPKSASILRATPSTLSAKRQTFGSGQQMQVSGVIKVGGYTWYQVLDPNTMVSGYIRGDQVSIVG